MRSAETDPTAAVIRLRPICTLVVSRDLDFREHAVTVLGELGMAGFAVASPCATEEVVALVARERPDVVVLDATGCGPAVEPVVDVLGQIAPSVGVVVVDADPDRGVASIDKWGAPAELVLSVQNAYRRGNPINEEPAHAYPQPC